jgi:hypothetical protein
MYVYIYICVCVCVCVYDIANITSGNFQSIATTYILD